MRVVPYRPWKGHQPLLVFDFLISLLNPRKDFKVLSCFMQKLILPPACSYNGLHRILSSYLLYLGLIAGCLNSLLTSRNPKNNWCLSRIFGTRSVEKIAVWAHAKSKQAGGWTHFCIPSHKWSCGLPINEMNELWPPWRIKKALNELTHERVWPSQCVFNTCVLHAQ